MEDINGILEKTFLSLDLDLSAQLDEKLAEYNITKSRAISLLGIEKKTFEEIIKGEAKHPSLINVLKIANFLGVDITEIIPSVLKNQSEAGIKSIQTAEKATFLAKNFDLKNLGKAGFFKNEVNNDDVDSLEKRLLLFFGFSSLKEYQVESAPLYSKTKRPFSDRMKTFWINSAYQCFRKINNPNDYDREGLKELLPKIKPYCQDLDKGLLIVCRALYGVGVTVIVQNHLTLTGIRGGTFIIDDKPCIVLTDIFRRYTTIWETLIHELSHVLFDYSIIRASIYHLTGDPDLYLIEEKAEEFSREYFCGLEDYKYIKPHIGNPFLVKRHAKELEVHPSFIYSSFRQFENLLNGKNYYKAFSEFFPPITSTLSNLKTLTWTEESLPEIANRIKADLALTSNNKYEENE